MGLEDLSSLQEPSIVGHRAGAKSAQQRSRSREKSQSHGERRCASHAERRRARVAEIDALHLAASLKGRREGPDDGPCSGTRVYDLPRRRPSKSRSRSGDFVPARASWQAKPGRPQASTVQSSYSFHRKSNDFLDFSEINSYEFHRD